MSFLHPWWLVPGLFVLPALGWLMKGSLAGFSPARKRVSIAVRAILVLLVLLALAAPRISVPSKDLCVVFVLDQSASISKEATEHARAFITGAISKKQRNDLAGAVVFAKTASLWEAPATGSGSLPRRPIPESVDHQQTRTADALKFASGFMPLDCSRRIVLLTDGNDTGGHMNQTAAALAASGIQLDTISLENPFTPEVLANNLQIPAQLRAGEPFDLTAAISSNVETAATVKLYQNQYLVEAKQVDLKPGNNQVKFPNLTSEGSSTAYEVEVVARKDTLAENNRCKALANVRGLPQVLILASEESRMAPLVQALRSQQMDVEVRPPNGAPKTMDELQRIDLLALADISSLQLGAQSMELYRRWVQEFGGGFLMLGGENSFGLGGYYKTPVEQMLPVRMEHQDRLDIPSVALLIVLDRSGSMSALVQGQTKIALANQGAIFALHALQPRDYFGVMAVDVRVHSVIPLQKPTLKPPLETKIQTITAGGGGIYIYTSLAAAFEALRDVPAQVKHVILFSDAADAEEKSAGETNAPQKTSGSALDLAAAMVSARISTSVVALGAETDKDTVFLRQLAERGNGRFYLTSDATSLPQIFSTETLKVAQSSLQEQPFQAVAATPHAITAGLDWSQSPLLLGNNTTVPKPTAQLLLTTDKGEPLLAVWRYGLGQTAAFTSDATSRWASEWLAWPGYGKFWAQTVRGLMRRNQQSPFALSQRVEDGRLYLEWDAVRTDGHFLNGLPLSLRALYSDGKSQHFIPRQDAPGHYKADVPAPQDGTAVFQLVTSNDGSAGAMDFSYTPAYPAELRSQSTQEKQIAQWTAAGGGRHNPPVEAIFERRNSLEAAPNIDAPARRTRDLTPFLLITALILVPVDIFLRRYTGQTVSRN